jgi:hypothetical protein
VDPVIGLEPIYRSWEELLGAWFIGGALGAGFGFTNEHRGVQLVQDFGTGVGVTILIIGVATIGHSVSGAVLM